jgi:hypothetical protein
MKVEHKMILETDQNVPDLPSHTDTELPVPERKTPEMERESLDESLAESQVQSHGELVDELSTIDDNPGDALDDPVARRVAIAALKAFRRIANEVANAGLLKLGYRRRQCLWPATPLDVRLMDNLAVLLASRGTPIAAWITSETPGFARSALEACNASPRKSLSTSAFFQFSLGRLGAARREGSAGKPKTQWATPVDKFTQTKGGQDGDAQHKFRS